MNRFNIYVTGVGGQGIGLLSEVILRAADHAGHPVKGVDTHGLAQRGGIVASQIRIGADVHSPLISTGGADLLVALEAHEALRGLEAVLKTGGTLVYYDAAWQPLPVRMAQGEQVRPAEIVQVCTRKNVRLIRVFEPQLADPRMQNMALLKNIRQEALIPEVSEDHYVAAMKDLMDGSMLEANLNFFLSKRSATA